MNKTTKAVLGATVSHIIYGFSFMFSKIALGVADTFVLLSLRFITAFLMLNILWALGIIKINFKGKKIGGLFIMGLFQPFLYFIFEQYGILYTSSAISGVVIALVPIAAMALSRIFFGERATKKQVLYALISLFGIVLISLCDGEGGDFTWFGFLLLVGAVLCAGGFNMLSRGLSGDFSPFERTYVMMALGTVGFTSIALFKLGGGYFGAAVSALADAGFLVSVLYLAVLSSVVAFACYNYATTYLSTTKATSFANIITVVSVLAGIVFLRESFNLIQLLSCLLILIGVFGVNKENQ